MRRIPIRKAMGWLHLWLGLASGLIVFVLEVMGCFYVFENELRPIVYSGRMTAQPHPAGAMPLSALWDIAQKELGDRYPIRRVAVENRPDRTWVFGYSKSDPKARTYFGETVWNYRVFVDPYSGQVKKVENTKYEFFTLDIWLHWSLLLSDRIGRPIMGSAVLCFVVILLTGMVLWWPRNRTVLWARLKVAWKARWKKVNWDLHSVFGFYAMSILLLIALTGLFWASLRMQSDQHTGALLKTKAFADQDRGEKLRSLNYDLHVGSILGLPGKILAFLASLVAATLPVTGLLIWLGKRKESGKERPS